MTRSECLTAEWPLCRVTWYWSCVFMSRTEGFGWKVGCEWYQPTTLKPRDDSTSQAWVWDTGSISHCNPVLTLLHGSAALICTQVGSANIVFLLYSDKQHICIFDISLTFNWFSSLLKTPPNKPITSLRETCACWATLEQFKEITE